MSIHLSTRIQHHESRADLLPELLARLDGLDPVVIADPGGRQRSTWRTHRLCLESIPDDATHLLVVQDDAWPCDEFADLARAAIEERPDRIICLFVPGVGILLRQVNAARVQGARWIDYPAITFAPTVAIVYPREHALAIPAYADKRRMSIGRADDGIVSTYVRAHRITPTATLPCLVEHRDEIESLMGMPHGNGQASRLAAWFEDDV